MTPKKSSGWYGFFLLLMLVLPALAGYDIYRQWQTPTMDFLLRGYDAATVHSVIPGGYAEKAGLEAGDVVLTVDDIPFAHWYEPEIGKTHILRVERRGEQFSLEIPATRVLKVNYPFLVSALIVSLTFWAVGTFFFLRRAERFETRLLFLLSQTVGLTVLFPLSYHAPWEPPAWTMTLSVASFNLSAPLLLHYALSFPFRLADSFWRRLGLGVAYLFALLSFGIWLFDSSLGRQIGIYSFSLTVTAALFAILYAYQYRANPTDRRRMRVIIFGTLAAILPSLILYLLPSALRSEPLISEWLAALFLLLAPLSYLYATLRYNLFDIDRLLNRTLVYVLLSLGIFVVYLGPYLFLYQFVADNFFVQLTFIFVLTLWVGWTFDRLRRRAKRLVDKIFYGGWYDYPAVVETVSNALARSSTREEVTNVLTRQLPELMRLKNASLQIGARDEPFSDTPSSPSLARFRIKFQSDIPAQWTIGIHRDGDDLSEEDQRILRTVAQQAEIALNNALMIETLRRQLDEIRASREALAQMQHRLLLSREEERSRLARDLHDGPIQSLIGMNIQLGLLLNSKGLSDSTARTFKEMRTEIRVLSSELRQVCAELRPPTLDALGLGAALRALAEEWARENQVEIELNIFSHADFRSLPDEVAVNFYRVAQETLTNIGKHAQATQIVLDLHYDKKRLTMTIHDNGIGFFAPKTLHGAAAENHFGLIGMKERMEQIGGTWTLDSDPGKGTTVNATWSAKEEPTPR